MKMHQQINHNCRGLGWWDPIVGSQNDISFKPFFYRGGDWQPHPGLQGRGAYQTLLSEKGSANKPSLSRWKSVRGTAGTVRAPGDPSTNSPSHFQATERGRTSLPPGHAPPVPPPDTAIHPPNGSVGTQRQPGPPGTPRCRSRARP